MSWKTAQQWESDWHGNCINTLGEEIKQTVYANRMGLTFYHNNKSPYNINAQNKKVIDIGGGPASLLLKCENLAVGCVIDPLKMPNWVLARYALANITVDQIPAEELVQTGFDEAWIYNCLQHTIDPEKIIQNAKKSAKVIRIFEWLETGVNVGHLHSFTEKQLTKWFGGYGKVELLKGDGLYGKCYYGVFPT